LQGAGCADFEVIPFGAERIQPKALQVYNGNRISRRLGEKRPAAEWQGVRLIQKSKSFVQCLWTVVSRNHCRLSVIFLYYKIKTPPPFGDGVFAREFAY
jgi:hypothetical protein